MKKQELKQIIKEILKEERATQLSNIIRSFKDSKMVDKIVAVDYMFDGVAGLIRTSDGNAYEIQLRPAGKSEHPSFKQYIQKND